MALQEPSWRIKTRPCPFYQQGRCMFSESCNFLHTVSLAANTDEKQSLSQPETPDSLDNSLRVIINSPESARSPPRSPRTTSLLFALRDVIGDPDNEDDTITANIWSESLPTLVNSEGFGLVSQHDQNTAEGEYNSYEDDEMDSEGNWTAISDYEDDVELTEVLNLNGNETASEDGEFQTCVAQLGVFDGVPEHEHSEPALKRESFASSAGSGLLSPIELSTLHLGPFRIGDQSRGTNSFDSGYAENWKAPIPLLSSPPRSPSVSSTFDLLSSPFGSHSQRIHSPHLSPFIARSPVSPARTVSYIVEDVEPSELDLDSPQQYRRDQQALYAPSDDHSDDEEEFGHVGEPEPATQHPYDPAELPLDSEELPPDSTGVPLDSADVSLDSADISLDLPDDDLEQDSYGHTSIWDSEGEPTAVFMGKGDEPLEEIHEEVDRELRRSSRTPTHFLVEELDFRDSELAANSSTVAPSADTEVDIADEDIADEDIADEEKEGSGSDEDTAYLAYLSSPNAPPPVVNDTLNSLYDVYSGIAADSMPATESIQTPDAGALHLPSPHISTPSTATSSLRERVFTPPPPTRKRSGTITADSPHSLPSPMSSLDSLSRGRESPFSDRLSAKSSGRQSPYSQDVEVSKKIPFGFRSSFALGHSSSSSLMINRQSGKSMPSSPLHIHTEGLSTESHNSGSQPSSANSIPKGLKLLRLSAILDTKYISRRRMSPSSLQSVNSFHSSGIPNRTSMSSASVSSSNSLYNNPLLSSSRSPIMSSPIHSTLLPSKDCTSSPLSLEFPEKPSNLAGPHSAPAVAWRTSINYSRPSSRLSEPIYEHDREDKDDDEDDGDTGQISRGPYDETIRRPVSTAPHRASISRPPSAMRQPLNYIETPKPTLMFAIASDDIEQVRKVLASGDAGPNDCLGPQSALEFTLTNDKLANKLDIVKALLAYGADPTAAKKIDVPTEPRSEEGDTEQTDVPQPVSRSLIDDMDPATRYYIDRADSIHTKRMSVLIHRSFFRPLTRVRYDLIGQDRALEQLFRVLSMHSRELAVSPMVVMLCGPSGHGKSLLARKFGSLLEVPTHTVNMTTLRSTLDLWESHSMSPYETPTTCTLAEFLTDNEGKRCVVVLDEIEKTEDPKILWSLLMPWELGRCAFEAGKRHVDVKNVIWLGTSNLGHDLVFRHQESRKSPESLMSREEYVELMALLRPKVSERLGASILSRITTVLPFVPFTMEERRAICSEALYSLGGEIARTLSSEVVDGVIDTALAEYCAEEGARSLHRAVSNQLVDII